MKKETSRHDFAQQDAARRNGAKLSSLARLGLAGALGASLLLVVPDNPNAQQRYKEPSVKVKSVTTSGNVVSISADGSMGRAQTWQDSEGFHVVLVNGQAEAGASAPGVKVRRVGNSLELVVGVKPGANVTVQPRGSRLDLVVSGGTSGPLQVENIAPEPRPQSAQRSKAEDAGERASHDVESAAPQSPPRRRAAESEAADAQRNSAQAPAQGTAQPAPAGSQAQPAQPAQQQPSDLVNLSPQPPPADAKPASAPAVNSAETQLTAGEGFDFLGFATSLPAMLGLLVLGLGGAALVVMRRRGKSSEEDSEVEEVEVGKKKKSRWKFGARETDEAAVKPFEQFKGDRRKSSMAVPFERRTSGRGADDEATREQRLGPDGENSERGLEVRGASQQFAAPVQFGAYRIDQEVARLVAGEPHSVEVIAARASDDRRAVETSLLKALRAPETDEDGRRRARMALEDYGYVARSCAQLLLGAESFERASAARTLGEMKSGQALPFLTEALYDADAVVRMECVQGLGSLGLPSAIGALLDVARRHPEVPASILSPALTACSVESLDLTWDSPEESRSFADEEFFDGEVHGLVSAAEYEELPEWVEDETLQSALERLSAAEADARANAAQQLAQFQVRRAVEALSASALHDRDSAVRSAAVTSLGLINHESVFVPVVISLSDEAREVRAAAARALSRLSFDRADAYVRVIESSDDETLRRVAKACVKAGLAAQAIGRIASEDRRHAYEAFSLLSLAAKGGELQPILDTVECHRDIEVRLACIRLLGLSYQPELGEQLRRIAANGGVPEKVRRAILDTVEGASQPQPVASL